jgi:hypothetical protein
MSDVIDLSRFKREPQSEPEFEKKPKTFRGLGVLINPPRSTSAFGVLGGNVGVTIPTKVAFNPELRLSKMGDEIRAALGIELLPSDEKPRSEPPGVA